MKKAYNLTVRDSVIRPDVNAFGFSSSHSRKEEVAFYNRINKNDEKELIRYQVWVYLEGPDLPFVDFVEYTLHSSFPDPVKKVPRSVVNPACSLEIWTWGIFEVGVRIVMKNGTNIHTRHRLSYDSNFENENIEWKSKAISGLSHAS